MTLSNLSIYVVFVDPHQDNNVMPSLPTTMELIGVVITRKSILTVHIL
jgi:hypothetical protein